MRLTRCLPALAALLSTALLGAWGPHGHAVVAELAWRELTPAVQARVAAILEGAPMNSVGSWADAVRPTDEFRWTAPLHYVNLPDNALRYIPERDCPEAGCVVSAIDDFAATIADENADPEARRQALMFLIHFVGDLHQPLHAGRQADRGGNDIEVEFYGSQRRLHSVWDSGIIEAADLGEWPTWADRLENQIDPMDRIAWTADLNATDLTNTAGRWAYESNRLALEYAYTATDGDVVQDEYVERTTPVIELRLSQGGVRLGAILNTILGE
ncbi:MAG: hypothetical protein ACI89L_002683 [Phycisphaerales bacterium]|jgi:hypothetical protein